MAIGDIESYLDDNNVHVNVEGPGGTFKKAVLIADSKAADPNTTQPVNVVENSAPGVEHFLFEELNAVNILSVSLDGKQITLSPGHNFLPPSYPDKDYLNVHYVDPLDTSFVGRRFSQLAVIGVTGDIIDVTPPFPYQPVLANIERQQRVNVNMAVLASRLAPIRFETFPPDDQIWDLRRFIGDMILTSGGDDGFFGNLPALDNGEYFGFENPSFKEYALAIFDNGGFRSAGYDVEYIPRSGGLGTNGMAFRKTVAGQEKSGVVITLEGATDDHFVNIKQDDLTGLVRFRIRIMGNIR